MPKKAISSSDQKEAEDMGLDVNEMVDVTEDQPEYGTENPNNAFPDKDSDQDTEKEPEKKPEVKPEEKKPEEKKVDQGKDGKKPDEGEEPDDSKEFVPKGQFAHFQREMNRNFKDLADSIKNLGQAKTPEEKKEAAKEVENKVDEFQEYANKYKDDKGRPLDTQGIKDLYDVFRQKILKEIPLDKIKNLDQLEPIMGKMSQSIEAEKFETEYGNSWQKSLPELKKEYPNASDSQIKTAQEKVREIVLSKKYGESYDLDYILFKERNTLKDILFSPKKKSSEDGQLGEADEDLGEDNSEARIQSLIDQGKFEEADAILEKIAKE